MKKIMMAMLVVGLTAMVAQGALVHYIFDEPVSGEWDVYVEVTAESGDTVGISNYAFNVYVPDPSTVTYDENTLFTFSLAEMTFVGFLDTTTVVKPFPFPVDPAFMNIGNYQGSGVSAIEGVGILDPLHVESFMPGTYPDVDLNRPAYLGTVYTPEGLLYANFVPETPALYGTSVDVFHEDPPTAGAGLTWEVDPIPEPITLSLLVLGAGGLSVIRRIRRRR